MLTHSDSQQQFIELRKMVCDLLPDKQPKLAGSFGVFYKWLVDTYPDIVKQAEEIARDIRLWRDAQDVLRQIWEYRFRR